MRRIRLTQRELYKLLLYLTGLAGTCVGVSLCLKSSMGVDAWNSAIAGLADATPLSLGQWTVIVHFSFWTMSALIDGRGRPEMIFPVIYKGLVLDMVKPLVDEISLSGDAGSRFAAFAAGYAVIAVSTGVYLSTGYPRMPIDGLMFSLSSFFKSNIRKARIIIEAAGFMVTMLVRGNMGVGTVIMTLTCGAAFSACKNISERTLMKKYNNGGGKTMDDMKSYALRLTRPGEEDEAMRFINDAKAFLKSKGVDQWQTGYPDEAAISGDILNKKGYFLTKNGNPIAYMCIDFDGEPAYDGLNRQWLTDSSYGVMHRLAIGSESRGRGMADIAFGLAEKLMKDRKVGSFRVDTDEDNHIMKHILSKNGFTYCGTIWFDNSVKIAYEKVFSVPAEMKEYEIKVQIYD